MTTNMERVIEYPEARQMTWFLFAGDMIVMLLMCVLVVWVYMKSTAESAQAAARIPLEDEYNDE